MLLSIEKIAEQLQGSYVGKKVVFCCGTFDLLHKGHIFGFLERAKAHGDILVVGVHCDENVSKRKGVERPIICQEDRAIVVSALACVDFVFIKESSPTKEQIIEMLNIDVVVWNGDAKLSGIHAEKRAYLAGKFPSVNFVSIPEDRKRGLSTTEIIRKIKNQT